MQTKNMTSTVVELKLYKSNLFKWKQIGENWDKKKITFQNWLKPWLIYLKIQNYIFTKKEIPPTKKIEYAENWQEFLVFSESVCLFSLPYSPFITCTKDIFAASSWDFEEFHSMGSMILFLIFPYWRLKVYFFSNVYCLPLVQKLPS